MVLGEVFGEETRQPSLGSELLTAYPDSLTSRSCWTMAQHRQHQTARASLFNNKFKIKWIPAYPRQLPSIPWRSRISCRWMQEIPTHPYKNILEENKLSDLREGRKQKRVKEGSRFHRYRGPFLLELTCGPSTGSSRPWRRGQVHRSNFKLIQIGPWIHQIPEESVLELAVRGFVAEWLAGNWGRHSESQKI